MKWRVIVTAAVALAVAATGYGLQMGVVESWHLMTAMVTLAAAFLCWTFPSWDD